MHIPKNLLCLHYQAFVKNLTDTENPKYITYLLVIHQVIQITTANKQKSHLQLIAATNKNDHVIVSKAFVFMLYH